MLLSFTTEAGDIFSVEIDPTMEVENLKALIHSECPQLPPERQQLFLNGSTALADDHKSLTSYGVTQNDILLVKYLAPPPSQTPTNTANNAGGGDRIEQLRQQILTDPNLMAQMASSQPELVQAALNDPTKFRRLMTAALNARTQQEQAQQAQMAALHADPFNEESQKKIADMIRLQNIQANMEHAMEHNPESFGSVHMLYIDCEVNGRKVKAFVDSGAQTTIMSPDCAEECRIMHLCDTRFAGIAKGVGTAKILGRIHATELKVGKSAEPGKNLFLQCSITVMEGKGVDMLLGLDMLKRFQACIDLAKGVLRIGTFETPFLAEHDLPDKAKMKAEVESSAKKLEEVGKSPESAATSVVKPPVNAAANTSIHPAPSKYSEDQVKMLMGLGASREQSIAALEAAGGNVDVAAGMLFE